MKEFETLAVVAPDPTANASQLLVDRVSQNPHAVLFANTLDNSAWR